jgi:AcrR family transcriptional regulator
MTQTRRMGPAGSAIWNQILDGAEGVLRDDGYAALTSRRIAERIGIQQRLVYYYFLSMDEIMVEAFRRLSRREIARLEEALNSERPLHEVWNVCIHTTDARLISEFMAIANRSEGVRQEVVHYIETTRALQVQALSRAAGSASSGLANLPSVAVTLMATSIALAITREAQLGISAGHAELESLIRDSLSALEPIG